MKGFEKPKQKFVAEARKKHRRLMTRVLKRIRDEGPLGSKDFKPPPGVKRGGWWSWKPAKMALELLLAQGDLMVVERRNFQRVYDLTERVLPGHVDTRTPANDELGRFLVRRALRAHGLARESEIHDHIHAADKKIISASLHAMAAAGEITAVALVEDPETVYYTTPETLHRAGRLRRRKKRLHILSPFDNLVIQRARLKTLFDFDYTLECYVPAPKRKHGYFVLPILWGETFAGRIDAVADRKGRRLDLRSLALEAGRETIDAMLAPLAGSLAAFARFNGCDEIAVANIRPAGVKRRLMKLIDSNL
jgi:uncharacterized protein YcaQ